MRQYRHSQTELYRGHKLLFKFTSQKNITFYPHEKSYLFQRAATERSIYVIHKYMIHVQNILTVVHVTYTWEY